MILIELSCLIEICNSTSMGFKYIIIIVVYERHQKGKKNEAYRGSNQRYLLNV